MCNFPLTTILYLVIAQVHPGLFSIYSLPLFLLWTTFVFTFFFFCGDISTTTQSVNCVCRQCAYRQAIIRRVTSVSYCLVHFDRRCFYQCQESMPTTMTVLNTNRACGWMLVRASGIAGSCVSECPQQRVRCARVVRTVTTVPTHAGRKATVVVVACTIIIHHFYYFFKYL